jgi:hypothetical protein
MFRFLFKKRVHEPIAAAVLSAAGVVLHFAWVSNLLAHRSAQAKEWFTISDVIGPISGMLLADVVIFLITFGFLAFVWSGRDCSHKRNTIFWFFITSILAFFVMTLPIVYGFGVNIV